MDFGELSNLGFDSWFQNELDPAKLEHFQLARITAVNRESYNVSVGEFELTAEVAGKIMFTAESPLDYPTVGDWCYTQIFDRESPAIIHEVLPRKSLLKRKASGKKVEFQAIAANIDHAFIIQSLNSDLNPSRLERYLVMIREGQIEPVILLSKSDLLSEKELELRTREILSAFQNVLVISFSSSSNNGIDAIKELLLPGKTFCLLGSSGVGKTTLLNNLLGKELLATKEIREKDDKGRHTTTSRQLLKLENGAMIIDTPGMRELGNIGTGSGIEEVFEDIAELEKRCKFSDCSHSNEKGCAILEALEQGALSSERFQNYIKILKESAHHEMSYVEKKKKYKELGKMYKSVQKQNRKH